MTNEQNITLIKNIANKVWRWFKLFIYVLFGFFIALIVLGATGALDAPQSSIKTEIEKPRISQVPIKDNAEPKSVKSKPIETKEETIKNKKSDKDIIRGEALAAFSDAQCSLWIKTYVKTIAKFDTDIDWLLEVTEWKAFSNINYYIFNGGGIKMQNGFGAFEKISWVCKVKETSVDGIFLINVDGNVISYIDGKNIIEFKKLHPSFKQ